MSTRIMSIITLHFKRKMRPRTALQKAMQGHIQLIMGTLPLLRSGRADPRRLRTLAVARPSFIAVRLSDRYAALRHGKASGILILRNEADLLMLTAHIKQLFHQLPVVRVHARIRLSLRKSDNRLLLLQKWPVDIFTHAFPFFSNSSLNCGGVTALMKAGFETLVEAGYDPQNAYFECIHEMKLIVDLIYKGGFKMMRYSISDTAEFGDYETGKRIITDETKKEMKKGLHEIQDGTFARNWIMENKMGRAHFNACRRIESEHQLEKVGAELRKLYEWNED